MRIINKNRSKLKFKRKYKNKKKGFPFFLRTYKFTRRGILGNHYIKKFTKYNDYIFLILKSTYKNFFFNLVDIFGNNLVVFSMGSIGNKKILLNIEKLTIKLIKFLKWKYKKVLLLVKIDANITDIRVLKCLNILILQKFIKILTYIDYRGYAHNGIRKRKLKRL